MLNDIAIAANVLMREHLDLKRILVVDLDVTETQHSPIGARVRVRVSRVRVSRVRVRRVRVSRVRVSRVGLVG